MAVFFTVASLPAVTYFLSDNLTALMVYFGTLSGLVIFAFFARWLWNSFAMLEKGMTITTGPGDYVVSFFIAGAVPTAVILVILGTVGIISHAGVFIFPAFLTGFAFVPWYVLALILLWETKSGCTLIFDKSARSFTAERCS